MASVDITYSDEQNECGLEIKPLILTAFSMHMDSFESLQNMVVTGTVTDEVLQLSREEALMEMDCEYQQLIAELQREIKSSKKLLKKKYPARYRWNVYKEIILRPLMFVYALIKTRK